MLGQDKEQLGQDEEHIYEPAISKEYSDGETDSQPSSRRQKSLLVQNNLHGIRSFGSFASYWFDKVLVFQSMKFNVAMSFHI